MTGREVAAEVESIISEITTLRSELDAAVSQKQEINREIAEEQRRIEDRKADADYLRQELQSFRKRKSR